MMLEIDIDPDTNKVTVEGKTDHKIGTKGGGSLRWMCPPDRGHQGWSVRFQGDSPFKNNQKEFGTSKGADGGVLARNEGKQERVFTYFVTCTDRDGKEHDTDPEIILWPETR